MCQYYDYLKFGLVSIVGEEKTGLSEEEIEYLFNNRFKFSLKRYIEEVDGQFGQLFNIREDILQELTRDCTNAEETYQECKAILESTVDNLIKVKMKMKASQSIDIDELILAKKESHAK